MCLVLIGYIRDDMGIHGNQQETFPLHPQNPNIDKPSTKENHSPGTTNSALPKIHHYI
jgi:hypothetical protein